MSSGGQRDSPPGVRRCGRCAEYKALVHFGRRKPNGYQSYCKPCVSAHSAEWRRRDRGRKARHYEWRVANPVLAAREDAAREADDEACYQEWREANPKQAAESDARIARYRAALDTVDPDLLPSPACTAST